MRSISNHPPHIMVEGHQDVSPSAFIPFCSFGGNRSVMGRFYDKFNTFVCDKFRPAYLDGQLCYQVDVNEQKNKVDGNKMEYHGIEFMLDYNFDRMAILIEDNYSTFKGTLSPKTIFKYVKEACLLVTMPCFFPSEMTKGKRKLDFS